MACLRCGKARGFERFMTLLLLSGLAAAARAEGFPEPTFVNTNGIRMAVYEEGEGFPVVFCHGWPELAYSWRSQLSALAKAGFRAIAPDQRGYGLTDSPAAVEDFDIVHLCNDIVGLLDALDIEKAVLCGHDWGGSIVWNTALLHPERVAGVIGVNTAFPQPRPGPPIPRLRAILGDDFYVVKFQEYGVAEAVLDKDPRKVFTMFMRRGGWMNPESFAKLPADSPLRRFELLKLLEIGDTPGELILNEEELDHYTNTFKKSGFRGGINWYRNSDRNWELMKDVKRHIAVPCLYVGAANDVVLRPSSANGMEAFVPDLEKITIADCGHWTQQEKPEELNEIIVTWLRKRFPNKGDNP